MIAVVTAIAMFGSGLSLGSLLPHIVGVQGTNESVIAVLFSLAGIAAMGADIPTGKLADRHPTWRVWGAALLLQGVGIAATVLISGIVGAIIGIVATVTLAAIAQTAGLAVIGELGTESGAKLRGYLRVVVNVFAALGALCAAGILALGGSAATALALCAIAALVAGVIALTSSRTRVRPIVTSDSAPNGSDRGITGRPWTDKRFLLFTILQGPSMWIGPLLTVAVPLWLTEVIAVPPQMLGIVIALNMALVSVLQVLSTKLARSDRSALRLATWGNVVLSGSMMLMAIQVFATAEVAILLVVAAIVVLSVGEVANSAGEFWLLFAWSDPARKGLYVGAYSSMGRISAIVVPLVVATLLPIAPAAVWTIPALLLAASGIAYSLLRRKLLRSTASLIQTKPEELSYE